VDAAVLDLLSEIAIEFDRTQFDRAVGFVVAADEFRHLAEDRLLGHLLGGELFRRRHIGHLVLMVERGFFIDMERHHDREDRIAVLDRGDPSGRIALAVAQPFDLVDDRDLRVAGRTRATNIPTDPRPPTAPEDDRDAPPPDQPNEPDRADESAKVIPLPVFDARKEAEQWRF